MLERDNFGPFWRLGQHRSLDPTTNIYIIQHDPNQIEIQVTTLEGEELSGNGQNQDEAAVDLLIQLEGGCDA